MNVDPFAALAHPDGARSALAAAFGRARIGPIVALTVGATTASVYRVEVGERRYLLRIEGQPSPLRNPHQYASMRIAAETGIAPKILYVDEAARIVVTDFIEEVTLETYPGGPPALARALGELLARVQATQVFPYFVEYPDIVARLFAHVRRTGLFAGGVLDQHVERLELLRGAYRASSGKLVSSHNDAVPNNILFDDRRLWLIDWESAYCNDPLVDVAIMLDGVARRPEMEEVLLGAWLGRAPDESIRERLDVVRAAGVFLSASAAVLWVKEEADLSVPSAVDFQRAIKAGRLKAGTAETKHILGKMFLASFLSGVAAPGFGAAV